MRALFQSMTSLASNVSQLKDFLGDIAAVNGDVSNVTAPPFLLAPKSAIEIPAAWASKHALFLQPATEHDPARRALLVAKNFICSLQQLVAENTEEAAKKPLNPFLGEMFIGEFNGQEGTTRMIAEQVSHHPPVTACSLYNNESGISSIGFVGQETSFSPMSGVTVTQPGYAVISDQHHDERHLMTMPTLLVKGLTSGRPYPELEGPCWIVSSSGFLTKIEFEGRGKLGLGSKNRLHAEISLLSNPEEILYDISGAWNAEMTIKDIKAGTTEKFHIDDIPSTPLSVRPVEQQTPWESRKAWKEVIEGIREGDTHKVGKHKNVIEESQRRRRQVEETKGTEWTSLFFKRSHPDGEIFQLLQQIPDDKWKTFDFERTDGSWKFIGGNAAEDAINHLKH